MSYKVVLVVLAYLYFAVTLCRSHPVRRFIDVDCDHPVFCTDEGKPVCGTDGETYKNKCAVESSNQKKLCEIGDFNPVIVVHEGPCEGHSTSSSPAPTTKPTAPTTTPTTTAATRATTTTTTPTTDTPRRTTTSAPQTRAP